MAVGAPCQAVPTLQCQNFNGNRDLRLCAWMNTQQTPLKHQVDPPAPVPALPLLDPCSNSVFVQQTTGAHSYTASGLLAFFGCCTAKLFSFPSYCSCTMHDRRIMLQNNLATPGAVVYTLQNQHASEPH
eukprot:GHUV01015112.1.p1 GENE.GHUV01015112.1~~GHUV01015112.1.p1  ORF type:complete len:129 (+),score=7.63 GHUV01015112.1:188-574(+)